MSPGPVRRGLHAAHAAAALGLLATGCLILWPDLRARLVGGYGRELGRVHLWLGIAFAAAPVAALLLAPRALPADLVRRLGPPDPPLAWRKVHLLLTLASSLALVVTGFVLWLGTGLPTPLWDAADSVHVVAHWVVAASLPVHLLRARGRIAERTRLLLGADPPPLFEFADDSGEDA